MKILAMDTSSKALSVAITDDETLLAEETLNIKKNHSIELMPTISRLMDQVSLKPADLNRIAVASGPGSYTGLRIAVTTAKTLAYTLGIDLVGVSSLAAIARNAKNYQGLIVPILDARRRNVYAGGYQWQSNELNLVFKEAHMSFFDLLAKVGDEPAYFTGEIEVFRQELDLLPNVTLEKNLKDCLPSAYQIALLGMGYQPQDIFSFVPEYLKKVEAEENWLKTHEEIDGLVEKFN
ncbi:MULTISPECIES: tRNA (adenosine(37)-N6)-threonylcarbamoyltransferase complex dimerization subunit type 1 TsaB [unclassified Enterococcus]|uniref:tRNA (adenosine(37)-N6)-threonylcarbamoyltransferase complex dimerization subunit type 1 TsaB n=1 Tax=unclassified Enterococcus TaxID=2608891 RepID=UPI001555ED45|nr:MULTISPECIES: tRNA (adenosine(37)-N6)-threonylcarbamoyltransferase complex dimerization subunit type 1 TsaB [unclassified Enterococcus]MBS7577800.1 tRNA (adenosine(37)-N6)-threonylcarbamoyltransferase complex dimerization subunit type 1 TsaB [Enterococcus sp. MMGLQ5-2]MBS7585060.1 tRNA (adenosine(37)-N6)-threonylcarbamoyltransferase complex dimerization subunit type 1 TsaB [Enterococcus sp. MMGLQ5-1]NPD12916.1 tRNA (adenosine(37)-N6)-threonylcarbamoyltransferase complex dimerization subunit t